MLVKLPKEVSKIMSKIQTSGFECYIVGDCIKESVLGKNPFGWDLSTNAGLEDLKKLFPEAEVLSEKLSVIRLEYIEEIKDKDGEVKGETGIIVDIATYREANQSEKPMLQDCEKAITINEDLERRDFTINAIAENQNGIVDPFGGRSDIRQKLVKAVGDADSSFKKEPIRMLKAVRLAAELDFDLHKSVYEAIVANHNLLGSVSVSKIRDEFTGIISADGAAGKGLSMLMGTGLIAAVIGQNVVDGLTKREMQDLTVLSQNIDRTQPVEDRRLGLFFACIGKKKIKPVIESFNFDEKTHQHLIDAVSDMPKLYFVGTKPELKKFIYKKGWDRYEYMTNLEKAQRLIFEYFSETKIRSKMHLLQEVQTNREPIFPEDLKIDANDLVEAGICKKEDTEKLLNMITEEIHTHPKKNNREQLLKLAKTYSKSKLLAMFRGISWSK